MRPTAQGSTLARHALGTMLLLVLSGCASTFSGMTSEQVSTLNSKLVGAKYWTKGPIPLRPDSDRIGVGRHVAVTADELVAGFTTYLHLLGPDGATGIVVLLNHDTGYDESAVLAAVDASLYRKDPATVRADLATRNDARQLTLADHGEIEVGMSQELVLWAYGNPDARKELADASGRIEVWGYTQFASPHGTVTLQDSKVIRFTTLK